MCLLLFSWQVDRSFPLMVAANRDERLDRPAHPMGVLRDQHPRVLGGHDDVAGGTWLGVNEHGVVAGLTNRPSPEGRDPSKRTRGELPLMLTGERTAEAGVETLVRRVQPAEYNPAWLLVGDRTALFSLSLSRSGPVTVVQLGPGLHILENVPLDEPSPKTEHVGSLVGPSGAAGDLWGRLPAVLADHTLPEPWPVADGASDQPVPRHPATLAACVHTEGYGTRSSTLVRVPADPASLPHVLAADGPPCTAPFTDVSRHWGR